MKNWQFFSIVAAIAVAVGAWYYNQTSDPLGTPAFNNHLAGQILAERAEMAHTPMILESVSKTQKLTLHGEPTLTFAINTKNCGTFYAVYDAKKQSHWHGGPNLLTTVNEKGFEGVETEAKQRQDKKEVLSDN
jgi:hypothetical protein